MGETPGSSAQCVHSVCEVTTGICESRGLDNENEGSRPCSSESYTNRSSSGSGHSCNGDSCAQPFLTEQRLQEEGEKVNAQLSSLPAGVLIIHECHLVKKREMFNGACSTIHDVVWGDRRFLLKEGAVNIALEMACTMEFMHARKLVHGELKFNNVLVGDDDHVYFCDFGCAAFIGDPPPVKHKRGTRPYMAPEVWNGGPKTTATDVFAFGELLYDFMLQFHRLRLCSDASIKKHYKAGDVFFEEPPKEDYPRGVERPDPFLHGPGS